MRASVLFLLGLAASGRAEMMGPETVPVERLLKNARENVRKHPRDPDAYYALGRIQYAIYCENDPRAIRMYRDKPPFRFTSTYPSWHRGERLHADPKTRKLVLDAITNLRSAVKFDEGREPGLYLLTLACVFEAAAPIGPEINAKETEEDWLKEAYRLYHLAFDASRGRDRAQEYKARPMTWERWLSVEAATAMLRLQPKRNASELRAHLKEIAEKPGGPITPIVFSLDSARPLEDLLDPSRDVGFDLDGTGRPQTYPWTKPDTALLVWQPDPGTPIRSGRQLFGSATWWMMYADGYAALAALDENGNGWIEGREMRGLAVWRDANQDGISDPGEVVSVTSVGIQALGTRSVGRVGSSPVCPNGLKMRDGRVLPTYDWVVAPRSVGEKR